MKINQRFIFTSLALVFVFSAIAQISKVSIQEDSLKHRIVFEPTSFMDNFYVGAAFGTQLLLTEDADYLKIKDRLTPVFSLNAGKWISPYWGLNFQLKGYALNGYSTVNGLYLADPIARNIYGNNDPVRNHVVIRPDGSYRHFLRYVHLNFELQASALNLILGYNENRIWDIIPSVGMGYMQVFNYKGIPASSSISNTFGLIGSYKYNDNLNFNVKLNSSILPDRFDGRLMGENYESYASVSLGVRYYFKKRAFKRLKPSLPIIQVVKEVEIQYEVVKQIDTVYVLKVTPYTQAKSIIASSNIKFQFKSAKRIDDLQDEKLLTLAQLMIENPDLKLLITGHTCDVDSYNKNIKIGLDRANVIKKHFVNLGVSPSQLSTISKSFDYPLVPNTTEENRAQNRRVELSILSPPKY